MSNSLCYIYHKNLWWKSTARKFLNDVCSFLIHFINHFIGENVKELHLFRDNCAGQNKSHAILRTVMALIEIKQLKIQYFFSTKRTFIFCHVIKILHKEKNFIVWLYTLEEYSYIKRILKSRDSKKCLVFLIDKNIFLFNHIFIAIFHYKTWFPLFYIKNNTAIGCLSCNKTN